MESAEPANKVIHLSKGPLPLYPKIQVIEKSHKIKPPTKKGELYALVELSQIRHVPIVSETEL